MTEGQKFTFDGAEYTIDMIGPVTTMLVCEDGSWQSVGTMLLKLFLESKNV